MPNANRLSRLRDPRTAQNAKQLRRNSTDAERALWYRLRAHRFEGWRFRRQVPLGRYVIDFLCEEARLVVEVDGGQHSERVSHDDERSRWLEGQGYRVVRYWNNEVMENLEGVLEDLLRVMAGEN